MGFLILHYMRASAGKGSVIYAVLSNTIVLVLIGFFSLLYLHTNSITNLLKEKINILVELSSDSTTVSPIALINIIQNNDKVVPNSVKLIKKDEASKILGIGISDSLKMVGSPFRDIISFNIKAEHYTEDNIKKIKSELKQKQGVFDIFYEHVVIDNIKDNLKNLSFIVLMLSMVFVFLALVIIYNTVNLSLYADRWEIKTMEIIGARDSFIRQPYIKIAGGIALKSFFLATIFLLGFIAYLIYAHQGLYGIVNWFYVGLSLLFIFIVSIIITIASTVRIVNKYLYKKESELY